MEENKLKIEYVDIETLVPYQKNAKIHTEEQIKQIEESIKKFDMIDPIGVWKDNTIIEGHGRLIACKNLGYKKVPIIHLDHLTDEERRAYTLAHNKLTMNTDFDFDILNDELGDIFNIDMSDFGFSMNLDEDEVRGLESGEAENPYTTKINIPQYEIKGEEPTISELYDITKTKELIQEIDSADITDEQKSFLKNAATRHTVFNYSKIAEYYAHQDKTMQELMEKSALVIIDFNDAIKNGYVELIKGIESITGDEDDDEE